MPKITYVTGNLLNTTCQAIVNTVNCVGIMEKGLALDVKTKYPGIMPLYQGHCEAGSLKPGMILYWLAPDGKIIMNCATKNDWRRSSKIEWIAGILCRFCYYNWQTSGITSLALSPMGCDNGNLEWKYVGPVMAAFLEPLPLERIEVYLPQEWHPYHIT